MKTIKFNLICMFMFKIGRIAHKLEMEAIEEKAFGYILRHCGMQGKVNGYVMADRSITFY